MQKKVGTAFVSLIKPMVIDDTGRFVMYLKGKLRADYTGIEAEPIYEMFDIVLPPEANGNTPLSNKKVLIPVHNVA